MSRRIEFTVNGDLPPKKDGANSMWGKSSEISRLIALRRAALSASEEGPLTTGIRLELTISCSSKELPRVGDLDNFITGVCDGLMALTNRPALTRQNPSMIA